MSLKTENNACVLNITTIQGLQTIVDLINGKLKTPKKQILLKKLE
jgi:hypothetical protein